MANTQTIDHVLRQAVHAHDVPGVVAMAATGTPGIISCGDAALPAPLLFDPGERWEYGINTEWVGKIVEAVSGQRLGDYLQQNIFAPLGMHSTSFKISPSQRARLASVHMRGPDDALAVFPFEFPPGAAGSEWRRRFIRYRARLPALHPDALASRHVQRQPGGAA